MTWGSSPANAYMAADASALFNFLTGYSQPGRLYKMHLSPKGMRRKFLALIQQEINQVQFGNKGYIIAKVNSLADQQIIQALYTASQAGVQIDLIVRGMCSLRPGIPGISDNIRVRSIVGRFLEHSRVFYFYNGGNELMYLSSADWRERNLDRRVEVLFPLEDPEILKEVKETLSIYLDDTVKARLLTSDGNWERIDRRGKEVINSQAYFSGLKGQLYSVQPSSTPPLHKRDREKGADALALVAATRDAPD